MKLKIIFCLMAAVCLLAPARSIAQTNSASSELRTQVQDLMKQIQEKVQANDRKEADYANIINSLDNLIAERKTGHSEEAAQLTFLKARLYLGVFDNDQKGRAILNQIKTDYPDSKIAGNIDKVLAQLDEAAEAKKAHANLVAGAAFPDFSESDLAGKPLSAASRKGKVLLVDFWATWCPPCRAELPNVIRTYGKYHDKGFEIIGVSLDSERDTLNTFLKKQDGMTWPQYFDGQGWSNKLAVKYGVQSIPFTILIGADGKIIDTDLRGEDLENAVAKALGGK